MSTPYVGEIRMFGGNFAPQGWLLCDGSLLPISEYETLFSLIGTTYGGDGMSTFALPDLRGRIPAHMGIGPGLSPYTIGEALGSETVTLTNQQIPSHTHAMSASTNVGGRTSPSNNVLARSTNADIYSGDAPSGAMAGTAVSTVGGSQPHGNLMPTLCVNFIISIYGIYPSPS